MWIFSRNDNSPIGFEIEPLETFKVLEAAEREGREMVSIFPFPHQLSAISFI